jgi:hypothetical protein
VFASTAKFLCRVVRNQDRALLPGIYRFARTLS